MATHRERHVFGVDSGVAMFVSKVGRAICPPFRLVTTTCPREHGQGTRTDKVWPNEFASASVDGHTGRDRIQVDPLDQPHYASIGQEPRTVACSDT